MIIYTVYAMGTTDAVAVRAFMSNAKLGVNSCLIVEADEDEDEEGKLSL